MKKFILLFVFALTGAIALQAQEVTKDSLDILKQEKKDLSVSKRLNENKIKLAKLQNMLQQKTDDVTTTAKDAQHAASDNQETAEKLNDDSQDKKLAKRAKKDAKKAEKAAKEGRHAADELEDIQKDIISLQKKIAEDEARLGIVKPVAVQ
jgi:hypothetical protein